MADEMNNNGGTETTQKTNTKKGGTKMSNNNGEQKKEGLWQRIKNGCKRNKKAIIAFALGVGAGAAGVGGVAKIGETSMRRKRNQEMIPPVQQDFNPLDPNM